MKINILSTILLLVFSLTINFSFSQEKNKDVGYWTILVNYRYKHEFEPKKEIMLKEVSSIAKRYQLEDEDTEVTHKGYTIRVMSKKTAELGRKWAQIEYVHH